MLDEYLIKLLKKSLKLILVIFAKNKKIFKKLEKKMRIIYNLNSVVEEFMKDKILGFLLFFIIVMIIIVMAGFGYVMYAEITGEHPITINFTGDGDLSISKGENINKNTTIIQASESNFGGVNENNKTNTSRNHNLYDQLDENAKKIYDKLYENRENLKTGTYKIEYGNTFQNLLSSSDGEAKLKKEYQSAIEVLVYENPEIFYIDATSMFINIEKITKITGTKYNVYIDNGNKESYLSEGFNSKEDVDKYQAEIKKVKDSILSVLEGKSDYEKIKIVHDYLVDTIEYDSSVSLDNIYNIYGALVSKVCVCEGYAKAFQYLMNEAGIENTIAIGTGTNSKGKTENHAWNYVKLDGKWYGIDTTWDDPILIGSGVLISKSKYQYFLKGSKTMNQNHFISGKFTDAGQTFTFPELSVENYE